MLRVKVKFFGPFREISNAKELEIKTADGSKVKDLLQLLTEKYGDEMKHTLFDPQTKQVRDSYQLLLNGRNIYALKGLDTCLEDESVLTLYPPVSGG